MTRVLVLGTLVAIGTCAVALSARQQPGRGGEPQARVIEVEKLRDNLFVLRGGGGNTAAFIGTTGVVIVDTKNPGWGQPILDAVRKLTDKPVTTIINTHTHGDHVSGNVEFPATVDIVTHVNTEANMKAMRTVSSFQPQPGATNIFTQHMGHGLPKRTFDDRMTLGSGADQIDLYYFGRGHTDGDAWIVFRGLRVMHAGDIFSGKNIPLIDANNGGSGVAIGDTLAKAAAGVGDVEAIVTGHSTVMTLADLREYAEFNREFLAAVQAGKKAGRSVDEIATSWAIPPKYAGYAEPQPARLRSNVEVIFNEIP